MAAFNVAIHAALNPGAAMAPHRGTEWDWYAVGGYDWPEVAAFIDSDGCWNEGPPPAGMPVIVLRCKG